MRPRTQRWWRFYYCSIYQKHNSDSSTVTRYPGIHVLCYMGYYYYNKQQQYSLRGQHTRLLLSEGCLWRCVRGIYQPLSFSDKSLENTRNKCVEAIIFGYRQHDGRPPDEAADLRETENSTGTRTRAEAVRRNLLWLRRTTVVQSLGGRLQAFVGTTTSWTDGCRLKVGNDTVPSKSIAKEKSGVPWYTGVVKKTARFIMIA